jgi:anaerobic selenocysteine-containing dehydrogenase
MTNGAKGHGPGSSWHSTFCRACNKACPVLAQVRDGRLERVTGDPENALYEGYTCVKGRQAPAFVNHGSRLLHSVKRSADGRFERIGFDAAVAEIGDRLRSIVERHGPRAVAVYTGTQLVNAPAGALIASFLKELGSPMRFEAFTIDKPGRAIAWSLLGRWQAPHHGFHDPDVALMLGINPFVNGVGGLPLGHPGKWLSDRMAKGMSLIVIDPRRTDVAKRATIHLAPRPGFDTQIVAAMIHVILAESLEHDAFVAENVDGIDKLRGAVGRFPPGDVALAADVAVDDLVRAARLFAGARRGYAVAGTGPHMSAPGTLLEYLVLALDTICGHWMGEGEEVRNPGVLTAPREFRAQAAPPHPAYGFGTPMRVRDLPQTVAGLPTSALAEEILTPGVGQVRALLSAGGNPVAAFPDQLLTIEAMRSLDLLVQVDPWMSQTAQLAHYVIAPRQWPEMAGTTQKLEKVVRSYSVGYAFRDNYAHHAPAIVEPPPGSEVVEDWELFYGLAHHLGLQLRITPERGFPIALDMKTKPTPDALLALTCVGSTVPLTRVSAAVHGGSFPLDTPALVAAKELDWPHRLDVANASMIADLDDLDVAPVDDHPDYPFRLLSRRMMHVVNSTFNDVSTNRGRSYNPAFLHPTDLAVACLAPGDAVTLHSPRASIPAIVERDVAVRPGTISMSFGFGGDRCDDHRVREIGSSTARLVAVDADYDHYSGQPRMSNVPVRIERAPDPLAGSRCDVASDDQA